MLTKKRYYYIDAVKSLAILLVCTYHFWNGGNNLYSADMSLGTMVRRFLMGFLSPCVPLFMVANGALLLNRPLDVPKHYRGLLSIVIQFFFWRSLTLLILGFRDGVDFSDFALTHWINYFLLMVQFNDVYEGHFWFIPMFCSIYLFVPLFKKVFDEESTDKNSRISLLILGAFLFCWNFLMHDFEVFKRVIPYVNQLETGYLDSFDPLSFYPGIMAVYFLLGGFLHKYRGTLAQIPFWLCLTIIGLAGIITFLSWYIMSSTQEGLYDNVFYGYGTTATLLSTAAIFILLQKAEPLLSASRKLTALLCCVGRNTLSVYYLHWIIGVALLPCIPLPVGLVSNAFRAIGFVAVGTLAAELLRKIPLIRHLIH